jgi:FkbM family methyltransferase
MRPAMSRPKVSANKGRSQPPTSEYDRGPMAGSLARSWLLCRTAGVAGVVRAASRRVARTKRRFHYLSKSDLLRGRRAYRVDGSVMELPDDMAWAFTDGTYYERNVEYWFRRALRAIPGPIVYDIGANYGYYSLIAASLADVVYAFEPVSSTYAILVRNIERNGLRTVKAIRSAIGPEPGTLPITLYSSSGNNSIALPPEAVDHLDIEGFEDVPVQTLDGLINEDRIKPPDLIKIDTEGGELGVLRGARRTLAVHKPLVILEHSEKIARDTGYTLDSIRAELTPHEYSLLSLDEAVVGNGGDLGLARVPFDGCLAAIGTLIAVPRAGVWSAVVQPTLHNG